MKTFLLALALSAAVAADPLDEALARYQTLKEGRVHFTVKPAEGPWQVKSTLVFRRPDRLHYWSDSAAPGRPNLQGHVWLDQGKQWDWVNLTGPNPTDPKNAYMSTEVPGGLKDAGAQALGPANYVLMLLAGDRTSFELDKSKASSPDVWTADGDQLVLDPSTRLLKEIVRWEEGKPAFRGTLEYSSQPVNDAELTWQMPADSTLIKP